MATTNNAQLATLAITRDNGKTLNIYFEPLNWDNDTANVYSVFRTDSNEDNIFNHLSIPGEIGDNIPGLDIVNKKDHLGDITLNGQNEGNWLYNGDQLSVPEQQQIAEHLKSTL